MKSKNVHRTSLLNCIANKGTSKIKQVAATSQTKAVFLCSIFFKDELLIA